METASATDKGLGLPLLFGTLAVLGAAGMAVFGFTGDQLAAGASFAAAMVTAGMAVAAYHVY